MALEILCSGGSLGFTTWLAGCYGVEGVEFRV